MFEKAKYKIWKHLNKKMEYLAATGEKTFLSKKEYKVWKHLSKQLNKKDEELEKRIQEMLTFGITGVLLKEIRSIRACPAKDPPLPIIEKDDEKPVVSNYKQIVSVNGLYISGASALSDFFKEFDNTTVFGHTPLKPLNRAEMSLFQEPSFFDFMDKFSSGTLLEKDRAIKGFISLIYRYSNDKSDPDFYNRKFLDNSIKFITSVLDLDDYTRAFMRDKQYPVRRVKEDTFDKCSFLRHQGVGQYVFYRYKEMSPDAFNNHAKDYIRSLFRLQSSKEFYCFLALAPTYVLNRLNSFMDKPIKRIIVWRDPRDQFVSAFRQDISLLPVTIDKYVTFSTYHIKYAFENPDPDTLLVRFEDLVLKYDETTKKIMNFIGMDASRHVNPKSIFDPSVSAANIGAYRYFEDQDFIRQIEERAGEYCYYPEKENLSDEAWNLLKTNNFAL